MQTLLSPVYHESWSNDGALGADRSWGFVKELCRKDVDAGSLSTLTEKRGAQSSSYVRLCPYFVDRDAYFSTCFYPWFAHDNDVKLTTVLGAPLPLRVLAVRPSKQDCPDHRRVSVLCGCGARWLRDSSSLVRGSSEGSPTRIRRNPCGDDKSPSP